MDQRLEPICTLLVADHPTVSQTLDSPTARQLVTVQDQNSPSHSWRVVTTFNLMKLKSSMKLPEGIAEFTALTLHALLNKNKL